MIDRHLGIEGVMYSIRTNEELYFMRKCFVPGAKLASDDRAFGFPRIQEQR
jgi:hypothetical protein